MSMAFNASFYLSNNPDVLSAVATGAMPSAEFHFNNFGWQEGRNPNANFDVNYYLIQNPDVLEAGVNPLMHFLAFGAGEGRQPNADFVSFADFDTAAYAAANPDLAEAGIETPEALYAHFATFGFAEDRPGTVTNDGEEIGTGGVPGGPTGTPGQTFTLTPGTDVLSGTSGDDIFVADRKGFDGILQDSLTNGDRLDGKGGNNTLVATINANVTPAELKNIQTIEVTNANAGLRTLDLLNAPDVTTLKTANNAGNLTFNNVQKALTGLDISNTNQDVTVNTFAAALAGTEDTLNVSLSNVSGGALAAGVTSGTNGYETIKIDSKGAVANTLASVGLAGVAPGTLAVTGSQNLTITASLAAATTKIDASEFKGNLDVTHTNAAVLDIKGGEGNDKFVLGNTYVGGTTGATRDIIDGGEGRNTLSIQSAQASVAVNQDNVTNIQVIEISNAVANNIDLTKFESADTLKLTNAGIGVNNFAFDSGNTLEFVTGAAGNNARAYSIAGTNTDDTLTFKAVAGTDLGTGDQTFNGIEVLKIETGAAAGTVTFGGALAMAPSVGGTAKIEASGAATLALAGVVTANEIDASGLTGTAALNMTGGGMAGAAKITGSGQADIIIGSAAADVIIAGGGNDNITSGGGNDSIDISGGGSNTINFDLTAAASGINTITGFQTGATAGGGDVLNVGTLGTFTLTDLVFSALNDQSTIVNNSVQIVNFNAAISGKDFGGADFADLFGGGKAFSATLGTNGDSGILVVQGTDRTEVYYASDADADGGNNNGTLVAGEVTLIGVLDGLTNASTFEIGNFA